MPTGRRGRFLALGLLTVMLAGAYLLIAAPLLDLYARRAARIDREHMLLPRLVAAASALPSLRAQVARLEAAAKTRNVTLAGASDAIASANLQSRIDALANSVGATIGSTESLPAATLGPYRRIGLRFVLSGPYEPLVRLLARIETATPPLVVDNLQIHGMLLRPGLRRHAGLNVGLDVYGFRSRTEPMAAKP
jgi:general secretion pathway protein M